MPTPSFPKREKQLLLPGPRHHHWILIIVALAMIAVVLTYAINPWFVLSDGAVGVIVQTLIGLFIVGVVLMVVVVAQLFLLVRKRAYQQAERSKNNLVLLLTFLLSVMLFATVIRLLQPLV